MVSDLFMKDDTTPIVGANRGRQEQLQDPGIDIGKPWKRPVRSKLFSVRLMREACRDDNGCLF